MGNLAGSTLAAASLGVFEETDLGQGSARVSHVYLGVPAEADVLMSVKYNPPNDKSLVAAGIPSTFNCRLSAFQRPFYYISDIGRGWTSSVNLLD